MSQLFGPARAGWTIRTAWSLLALSLASVGAGTAQEAAGPTNAERLQPAVPVSVSPQAEQAAVSDSDAESEATGEAEIAQEHEGELGPWGERRSLAAAVGEVRAVAWKES